MAENDSRKNNQNNERQPFRKEMADKDFGDTAKAARSFARPQKPVRIKPEETGAASGKTRRMSPVKPEVKPKDHAAGDKTVAVKAVSETRKMEPGEALKIRSAGRDDATKLQHAVKPPDKVQTVKVSSDAKVPRRAEPKTKQGIRVAARNRQAAEMESIFRHEARMTELPNSRSYFSRLFRLKRNGPSKIYRLKGFANREYVKQQRKRTQRFYKRLNIIFWILVITGLLIVFYWLNPIDKIQELMHLFGM